jgi:hypothetical protein
MPIPSDCGCGDGVARRHRAHVMELFIFVDARDQVERLLLFILMNNIRDYDDVFRESNAANMQRDDARPGFRVRRTCLFAHMDRQGR